MSILIARARFVVFRGAMRSADDGSPETVEWFVEADHSAALRRARALVRSRHERRANSYGVIIISTLLFVLFASALTVGGHAVISPFVRATVAARNARDSGEVVFTMPDGLFCRHMSFDNLTGEVRGGEIARCAHPVAGSGAANSRFQWGGH